MNDDDFSNMHPVTFLFGLLFTIIVFLVFWLVFSQVAEVLGGFIDWLNGLVS